MKKLTGMRDFIEEKSDNYLYFIKIASEIAENYGFSFIKSPLLEETSLFRRTAGETTDVVSKEMYDFKDKGGEDISLRPEGTAGVMRYFLENGMDKLKTKKRLYYYGSMFRYERPQKGRFREFNQFGCESMGEDSVYEDVNTLLMVNAILKALNIETTLKINSLGCPACRKKYIAKLLEYLENKKDICDDCKTRKIKNPLRVLDCKVDREKYVDAPFLKDNLCESCEESFSIIKEELDYNDIPYEIDNNLVRGLDYYNNLVFEFTSNELGAQDAVCGGGRYNGLSEQLGGKPVPAVGFAFGIDRVMELLSKEIEEIDKIFICALDKDSLRYANYVAKLYREEYPVVLDYTIKSVGKQIKKAEKANCNKFIVIGQNEVESESIKIKDLKTGKEVEVKL